MKKGMDFELLLKETIREAGEDFEFIRKENSGKDFCGYPLTTDDEVITIGVMVQSRDVLEKDPNNSDEKWNAFEWEYGGSEKGFSRVSKMLRAKSNYDEKNYKAWVKYRKKVLETFVDAMHALVKEGFFGDEKERDRIFISVSVCDSDEGESNPQWYKKLNTKTMYEEYSKPTLHGAAWDGDLDTVKQLLDNGADVNLKDSDMTALHYATSGKHEKIVVLLLESGADANARDGTDRTPLITAAFWGHIGIARRLIEKGADVNAKDNIGTTALDQAQNVGLKSLLRSHGAKTGKELKKEKGK